MSYEFISLCNHQQPLGVMLLIMLEGHSSLFGEGEQNCRPWEEVQMGHLNILIFISICAHQNQPFL